jgi:superfamily II DNA or RNA helicase
MAKKMKVTLRKYQELGVRDLRLAFMQGHRSILYVLPTGGGKTVIFCHIAEQAATKGNRIVILVHRQELVDQTSKALSALGVHHGIIASDHQMDLTYSVQVASVQTLVRRLHKIPADYFQLLVVDEAHHAVAGSWSNVIDHYPKAKVLGVTATPERLDGQGLKDKFTKMIVGPQLAELTEQGHLAKARVFCPPIKIDLSKLEKKMGDYDMALAEQELMMADTVGDSVKHFKRWIKDGTAIAFCTTVAHSQSVAETFNENGIAAAHLDGKMAKDERRKLIKQLGTGEIRVLTSCQIISEGTDVPSVTGCLLLRPTLSLSLYLQQVGRCLRPSPGKAAAIILDHVGNVKKHGMPDQHREWSLNAKKRSKRNLEEEVHVKVCPECFMTVISQTQVCPTCGHVFTTTPARHKYVDEDLQEMTAIKADERLEQRRKKAQVGQARTLDELIALGKERNYKPGWAHYIYNSRHIKRYGRQQ